MVDIYRAGKENAVIFIRKFLIGNRSVKGFVIVFCLLQDFFIRRDPSLLQALASWEGQKGRVREK